MSKTFYQKFRFCLGSRSSETGSELSQSVSSLDRDDDESQSHHQQTIPPPTIPEFDVLPTTTATTTTTKPQVATNDFLEIERQTTVAEHAVSQPSNEMVLANEQEQSLTLAREKSTQEKVSYF